MLISSGLFHEYTLDAELDYPVSSDPEQREKFLYCKENSDRAWSYDK